MKQGGIKPAASDFGLAASASADGIKSLDTLLNNLLSKLQNCNSTLSAMTNKGFQKAGQLMNALFSGGLSNAELRQEKKNLVKEQQDYNNTYKMKNIVNDNIGNLEISHDQNVFQFNQFKTSAEQKEARARTYFYERDNKTHNTGTRLYTHKERQETNMNTGVNIHSRVQGAALKTQPPGTILSIKA
jgi:hypothetical protein